MTDTDYKTARKNLKLRTEQADANRAESEAALAAHDVIIRALRADAEQRAYEYDLAGDDYHRIYRFAGPVTSQAAATAMSILSKWSRLHPGEDIEVVFNSPGGSVIDGMALWDFLAHLKSKGHRLTTVCRGYAASMAGILLQAGDVRVMGAESYLMIHEISAGAGGKIGEIQDAVKFYEKICDRVVDIFVNRSGKISKTQFKKNWSRSDWWLSSSESLALGFCDEVR